MIRINDSDKFESIVSNIENSKKEIERIFKETTNNIERTNNPEIWSGIAQEEFSNKYKLLSSNYEPINNSLDIYIRFMKQTIEDYKEFEEKTKSNIEKNNIELDVNS